MGAPTKLADLFNILLVVFRPGPGSVWRKAQNDIPAIQCRGRLSEITLSIQAVNVSNSSARRSESLRPVRAGT
jgi:hypothetical protein